MNSPALRALRRFSIVIAIVAGVCALIFGILYPIAWLEVHGHPMLIGAYVGVVLAGIIYSLCYIHELDHS